jgi:hypothetical protein
MHFRQIRGDRLRRTAVRTRLLVPRLARQALAAVMLGWHCRATAAQPAVAFWVVVTRIALPTEEQIAAT